MKADFSDKYQVQIWTVNLPHRKLGQLTLSVSLLLSQLGHKRLGTDFCPAKYDEVDHMIYANVTLLLQICVLWWTDLREQRLKFPKPTA